MAGPRDVFDHHNWGERNCWHLMGEARVAAQHPPAADVTSAELRARGLEGFQVAGGLEG